ncbi:MAG: hypothetical protein UR68_C0032G0012 [Candidatus Roizmanbacteria bacterium GW2011_GWA2_35_19]|uniref:Uncharacterized protein n=2 Tax=Candidatus Roizmaniibacteriota TaxID=1752723 RepID=A0A0G0C5Y3_9BACT|nr:MAG: hypothetical protein UR63_C0038G0005 [Candidatus Roizmanbacteria bacterium GW2011_GWC2_35_12]KKP71561.1 MAG: hypothetical protein UR68_C0032G0012 [Candidatus Roizmanbacteria bacterium GW2011_GWA2_35_19]
MANFLKKIFRKNIEVKYSKHEVVETLIKSFSLLETDFDKACDILFPYVPVNGPIAVDYGIYTLQYALTFGDEILEIEKSNPKSKFSMPGEVNEIITECQKKNINGYKELLVWSHEKIKLATDQMKRANATMSAVYYSFDELVANNNKSYKKDLNLVQIKEMDHHFLVNAYKDLFEISFFLELLLNLQFIKNGENFSNNPFKNLKFNNKPIINKSSFLNKGLAVAYLNKVLSGSLKILLNSTFIPEIRKLAGHNNYTFNKKTNTYIFNEQNKKQISFEFVSKCFTNLGLFENALRLELNKHYLEEFNQESPRVDKIGFMDWRFSKDEKEILILQYWSNFIRLQEQKPPEEISFYRIPLQTNDSIKRICLGFDKKYHFPYDLRVIANKLSLKLMKNLNKKNSITIKIIGVAPNVDPFSKMSKVLVSLRNRKMVVIGEITTHVKINHRNLNSLINFLEKF